MLSIAGEDSVLSSNAVMLSDSDGDSHQDIFQTIIPYTKRAYEILLGSIG